jgi:2-C-methyl-D-erythritol 4-phosphate cytidylyltransferase
VLVHDAARPCLSPAMLSALCDELADDPVGGLLAVPVADTLKRADRRQRVARTEPRDDLWQAQTPQMFRYGLLSHGPSPSTRAAPTRRRRSRPPVCGRGWSRPTPAISR